MPVDPLHPPLWFVREDATLYMIVVRPDVTAATHSLLRKGSTTTPYLTHDDDVKGPFCTIRQTEPLNLEWTLICGANDRSTCSTGDGSFLPWPPIKVSIFQGQMHDIVHVEHHHES